MIRGAIAQELTVTLRYHCWNDQPRASTKNIKNASGYPAGLWMLPEASSTTLLGVGAIGVERLNLTVFTFRRHGTHRPSSLRGLLLFLLWLSTPGALKQTKFSCRI